MTDLINTAWTIARSALLTQQQRLTVIANNIANVNTPGYTRRDVLLATVQETPSSIQEVRDYSIGVGVRVADVVRAQSTAIQNLLRQQTGDTQGHETRADALSQLEGLLTADGDNSLDAQLDAFWNAWSDLSNQADNVALRTVVVQSGATLAATFNNLQGRIADFSEQLIGGTAGAFTGTLPSDVATFNTLTSQLQDLNARISYSLSSFDPAGLQDQRETLLVELGKLADIEVGPDSTVTLGGQTVVSGNGAQRSELVVTGGGPPPTFEVGGVSVGIESGSLGALSDVLDIAAGMGDRLDVLATELMTAVNSLHNSDRNAAGDTYDLNGERCDWDFFTGAGAGDIAVNLSIYDPSRPLEMDAGRVAAASSRYEAGPPPIPNAGDGSIALQIADLASETRAALGGQTMSGYYTTGMVLLGNLVQTEETLAEDGASVVGTLTDALQSEVGVNMEEELMKMLQAQRSFDAAAQMLTKIDEMIQTVLQL